MNSSLVTARCRKAAILIAVCSCLLITGTAHADRWIVPASANVSGTAGTNWRTDLRMVNTEDNVGLGPGLPAQERAEQRRLDTFVDVIVPADGQVQIDNILAVEVLVFGFSGPSHRCAG